MKKQKNPVLKLTKESPEARKRRVSSGVRFRPAVMPDKKKHRMPPDIEEQEK